MPNEYDLQLRARSVDELENALREIDQHDNLLVEHYEGMVRRFHSPRTIRNVLRGGSEAEE